MKVEGPRKPRSDAAGAASGDAKGRQGSPGATTAGQESAFQSTFEEMEAVRLIEELEQVGDRLSRYPSLSLMARYRGLVRLLLRKAQEGIRVRRDFRWRRTERTLYVLIQRTDSALEEMEEILRREGDRTRLLDLVEEVKGCLISMLS
ncbi:DUF327 family protein [Aminomonas paucivorans]|uniref:DUF327 domain-containing protein n=1 Tax=Aminomonas paucivorans DSM 12260 TaxID=584708 RepID=E3CZ94_9BACT|nr:DUF327 family protein [Aminomonas paucivorans]EFQ23765.1 protein of unknown function DUF327 [Aminomonas paucivorans DSM 12260]